MYELEDISTIIDDAGIASLGVNLFEYSAPADAVNCIILYPSNDPPRIDPETPGLLKGKFQTIVRCATHSYGLQLSKQLSEALTIAHIETPLMKVKDLRPLYQPRVYRRADSGLLEFSVTYQIIYVVK